MVLTLLRGLILWPWHYAGVRGKPCWFLGLGLPLDCKEPCFDWIKCGDAILLPRDKGWSPGWVNCCCLLFVSTLPHGLLTAPKISLLSLLPRIPLKHQPPKGNSFQFAPEGSPMLICGSQSSPLNPGFIWRDQWAIQCPRLLCYYA